MTTECLRDRDQRRSSEITVNEKILQQVFSHLFDIEHTGGQTDLVPVMAAIHAQDTEKVRTLLDNVLPRADWVRLKQANIVQDWGGMKVSADCAVIHPRLRATVCLVISVSDIQLTLGAIEYVDAAFVHSLAQSSQSMPERRQTARRVAPLNQMAQVAAVVGPFAVK